MVALLSFADGESFANGRAECEFGPASSDDNSTRVIVEVLIENILVQAVVDTGAPYIVWAPAVAQQVDLSSLEQIEEITLVTRAGRIKGALYRMSVTFPASDGEALPIDATVFVPHSAEEWHHLPSFVGLTGCLERMRFAIDPSADMIYFGPIDH